MVATHSKLNYITFPIYTFVDKNKGSGRIILDCKTFSEESDAQRVSIQRYDASNGKSSITPSVKVTIISGLIQRLIAHSIKPTKRHQPRRLSSRSNALPTIRLRLLPCRQDLEQVLCRLSRAHPLATQALGIPRASRPPEAGDPCLGDRSPLPGPSPRRGLPERKRSGNASPRSTRMRQNPNSW